MLVSGLPFYLFSLCVARAAASIIPAVRRADSPFDSAFWIWTSLADPSDGSVPLGTSDFRRTYITPTGQKAKSVSVLITADNTFALYLNGRPIGEHNDWKTAKLFTVDGRNGLNPDKNVFAVEAKNSPANLPGPNPGGVLVSVRVEMESGQADSFVSDETWKAMPRAVVGFESLEDDSDWGRATSMGKYGIQPWREQVMISAEARQTQMSKSVASPTAQPIRGTSVPEEVEGAVNTRKSVNVVAIVGGIVGGLGILAIGILVFFFVRRQRKIVAQQSFTPRPFQNQFMTSVSYTNRPLTFTSLSTDSFQRASTISFAQEKMVVQSPSRFPNPFSRSSVTSAQDFSAPPRSFMTV